VVLPRLPKQWPLAPETSTLACVSPNYDNRHRTLVMKDVIVK